MFVCRIHAWIVKSKPPLPTRSFFLKLQVRESGSTFPSLQLQKKTVWCREAKGGQVWYGLGREKIFVCFAPAYGKFSQTMQFANQKSFNNGFRFVSPFTLKWTFPHLNDLVLLFSAHFLFSKSKHSQQFAISKWEKLLNVAKMCGQWKSHLETLHSPKTWQKNACFVSASCFWYRTSTSKKKLRSSAVNFCVRLRKKDHKFHSIIHGTGIFPYIQH